VNRHPSISELLNLEAYTADRNLFISKIPGALDKKPLVGCVYEMTPLSGGGEEFMTVAAALFRSLPDDSVLQSSLLSFPDHNGPARTLLGKSQCTGVLQELMNRQKVLFERMLQPGWSEHTPILSRRTLIFTLMTPISKLSEEQLQESELLQNEFLINLRSCGFRDAIALTAPEVLGLQRQFARIYEPRQIPQLDPYVELKHQVFSAEDYFDETRNPVGMTGVHAACLAIKTYPENPYPAMMNLVSGAPMNKGKVTEGGGDRVKLPFIITTTIRLAKQRREHKRIREGIKSRENTRPPPIQLGHENPADVTKDLMHLRDQCDGEKDKLVYASTVIFAFGKTQEQALNALSEMKGNLTKLGFGVGLPPFNSLVRWAQTLPMNFNPEIADQLQNEAIMPSAEASCLMPMYGDYSGNSDPLFGANSAGVPFITRRGLLHCWDPFKTNTNKNGVIYAASGAGKSFKLQYTVCNLLASDTRVLLLDNGRSAKKLCLALGGNYFDFTLDPGEKPNLNPFFGLSEDDFNEQSATIAELVLMMCYSLGEIRDRGARIAMQEAVLAAYGKKQNYADISTVVESLENVKNNSSAESGGEVTEAVVNLIPRLKAFIGQPSRSPYFKGTVSLDVSNPFNVCELKGLEGDPHLRQVALFFILNMAMTRMKALSGRKAILVDEASDLLKDDGPAAAMEGLYRKGRKENVSVWIVSQSPRDQANNATGRVILSQSAWKVILQQDKDELKKVIDEGVIAEFANSPHFNLLIRDVETLKGQWSEALIIGGGNYEVVRLYVDQFMNLLFTTDPDENTGLMAEIAAGVPPVEAIDQAMGNRDREIKHWLSGVVKHLRDIEGVPLNLALQHLKEAYHD
jgi:conjugal transfer ATP-binding protein TraC